MDILLIEDEPKTAQTVRSFLQESHMRVDYAADGLAGRRLALQYDYDVIISDVVMPNIDGIGLCQSLREKGVRSPILLLSALSQTDDKVAGLNAGADDYLAKPFDLQELLARVQALARRANGQLHTSTKLVFADLEMNLATLEVTRDGRSISLTPREFALLEYLVRNPERVVPKAELLEQVWNIDEQINTNVIEVYVGYVRNKVDKGFGVKLIHTHFGVGYILKKEDN
jgi:two-component system, OmpR family, copper resistance phosphate regulon response regulator CusR